MTNIAREIEELRRMETTQLLERYREVFGKEAKIKSPAWLQRQVVWKIQELRARAEEPKGLGARTKIPPEAAGAPPEAPRRPRKPGEPAVGTAIVRRWHGKDLLVRVLEGGYEFEGVVYRSLSAVAKVATGAHWNGRFFFKLVGRKKP